MQSPNIKVTVVLEIPTDRFDWELDVQEGLDWAAEEAMDLVSGRAGKETSSVQLNSGRFNVQVQRR